MSLLVKCLKCGSEFKGKTELAGRKIKCPKCGGVIAIPAIAPVPEVRAESPGGSVPAQSPGIPSDPSSRPHSAVPVSRTVAMPPAPPIPSVSGVAVPVDNEPAWTTPRWTDEDSDFVSKPAVSPAANRVSESVFGVPEPAPLLNRILAYILDILPTLILFPIALIPIIGQIFMGILLLLYWLLRDTWGASLGKWAMGLEVRSANGQPTLGGPRILRNIPFAVYPSIMILVGMGSILALIIPPLAILVSYVGLMMVVGVAFVVVVTEATMLLVTGRRIGDRIAGTAVFTRPR